MSDIATLFADIDTYIESLDKQILTRKNELANIYASIESEQKEFKIVAQKLADMKIQFAKEIGQLEIEKSPLIKEVQRLKNEVNMLVAQKGDLKLANMQLDKKNKEFKVYEIQAWQALNAKDKSLLGRESSLEQRENLKPTKQSFLPSISD
jgi:CRISPR/Cas system CSM-associated protein Csm2 small subunit